MPRAIRSASGGFGLIEVMIAFALAMGLAYAVATIFGQINSGNFRATLTGTAQVIRQNQMEMLGNAKAWENTLLYPKNLSFACVQQLADCASAGVADPTRTFAIRDPANVLYYDGMNPQAGYTENGAPCGQFPAGTCTLRVELAWRAYCPATPPCLLPQLEVTGRVIYQPTDPHKRIAFNPDNYKFTLVKSIPNSSAFPQPSASPSAIPSGTSPLATLIAADSGLGAAGGGGLPAGGDLQQQAEALCQLFAGAGDPAQTAQMLKDQLAASGYAALAPYVDSMAATCAKKSP